MKKLLLLLTMLTLVLSACAPFGGKEEEEVTQKTDETKETKETAIIPMYNISDSYYKMVLPFKQGAARGLTAERLNTRLDIDEFETGLMRLATESFNTNDYLFQEGQHLDEDTVLSWLARKKTGSDLKKAEKEDKDFKNLGLNPALPNSGSTKSKNENSPIYLASMLEHNYLIRKDKNSLQLGGVVIGLELNSVYYYREKIGDPQQEVTIDSSKNSKKLLAEGEKIAEQVIKRIRQMDGLQKVPVMIALYKQAPKSSIVPGNFIAKTDVKAGSADIGNWDTIKEENVFFPSDSAKSSYKDDSERFDRFKTKVEDYFPNYTGVVGKGFYKNGNLQKMKIEIPMQFYEKTEVVAFTQYLTGEVMDYYKSTNIEINITSSDQQEALITKNAEDKEPTVHIYD